MIGKHWERMVLLLSIVISVLLSAYVARALLFSSVKIPVVGIVKTVGINAYSDFECSIPLTAIDWGHLEPATSLDRFIYLRNEGNIPVVLYLSTENWVPARASTYISLNWNYTEVIISPNEVVAVMLTLTIEPNIENVESFSFDIRIVAEERT